MRKEVLERFQADATKLFNRIKEEDRTLFDYQVALLILLSHIPTTPYFKEVLKLEIVRLIDVELSLGLSSSSPEKQNGLLPEQQK